MIDLTHATFSELDPAPLDKFDQLLTPMLAPGEEIFAAFDTVRDGIVFTNKRLIAMDYQGLTGKKKDITSLPYRRLTAFSVITDGLLDGDCELELWFAGVGKILFELDDRTDIPGLCQILATYAL